MYKRQVFFIPSACSDQEIGLNRYIELPEVRRFYPSEYINEPIVVFKNKFGNEILMNVLYHEDIVEQDLGQSKIDMDEFTVQLFSSEHELSISLLGTAYLTQDLSTITPTILANLMPFGDTRGVKMDIRINTNTVTSSHNAEYLDQIILGEKSFQSVYSVSSEALLSYSELYLTKKEGVIAFKDVHNQLWVYDRMEI